MKRILLWIVLPAYMLAMSACSGHKHHDEHSHEHQTQKDTDHLDHDDEHSNHAEGEADEHHHDEHEKEHDLKYGVLEIKPSDFSNTINTSGVIMPAQGDELTLSAPHDGIVIFKQKPLMAGMSVTKGSSLLSISGKGLIHDNIETSYIEAKAAYEKASVNYERAKTLNQDKIISDKELAETETAYLQAKNSFDILKQNYTPGGQSITAKTDGFIKDVLIAEGEYVETGQSLLRIVQKKRLVLKADVPQHFLGKLNEVSSANFITPYDGQLYKTHEMNGQLVSFGKTTLANSLFTPIYFEIDGNDDLLPGTFVEIFLKTNTVSNAIVVPKSALMEEAGRYYVFAEDHHENFEKRFITIDGNDGENYHITSGLKPGDHVATKNTYQIKLASLSSSLPAHTHQH